MSQTEAQHCKHCGSLYEPGPNRPDGFCCNGCAYVFRLIEEQGLTQFYDLRPAAVSPVGAAPLTPHDFAWLREEQERIEVHAQTAGKKLAEAVFHLRGISCVGCTWIIERLMEETPGGIRAVASPATGELHLAWAVGGFELETFARKLQDFGYIVAPQTADRPKGSRELVTRMGLAGAFALNAMLFTLPRYLGMEDDFQLAGLFGLLTLLFATLSFVIGGTWFGVRAWRSLKAGILHIDLPIAGGLILAYVGSLIGWAIGEERFLYFDFVSIFTFLMLLGRWMQERAVEQNQAKVAHQPAGPPTVERVSKEGSEKVPSTAIHVGDKLVFEPGALLPVTAEVIEPEAECTLEWINGEPEVQPFPKGRRIPAGARYVGRLPLTVRAVERWEDSLLARLVAPPPEKSSDPWLQRLLRVYLTLVLIIAAVGGVAWATLGGDPLTGWQVTLSVLVISCPCAIGLAAPLAQELANARLQRSGVFVQRADLYRRLRAVRTLIFDKTGTLTFETPALANPEALEELDPEARGVLLQMVQSSLHPLSRSLREHLLRGVRPAADAAPTVSLHEETGFGLIGEAQDGRWTLGRAGWRGASGVANAPLDPAVASPTGAADVEFAKNGVALAHFRFTDDLRDHVRSTFNELRQRYHIQLLSGDRAPKVAAMCERLGLPADAGLGGLIPQEKASWVEAQPAGSTLFIGDGANDSLAFDAAAAKGAPVIDQSILTSKADFFLLSRGLDGVQGLLQTGRSHQRAVRGAFGFAICYNLAAVAVCLFGAMNPLLAAILMPTSSLLSIGIVFQSMKR
jgi:Cu2+-exporting ATPase